MSDLNEPALRACLVAARPHLDPAQIESLLTALRRQHDDPEEHDRSLIAERLAWTPEERLTAMEQVLDFVDSARVASSQ